MKNHITKYLSQFSHAIELVQFPNDKQWHSALIIPACGESPSLLDKVLQNHAESSVLVVLCVNRPKGHIKTDDWSYQNQALIENIKHNSSKEIPLGSHTYYDMPNAWDCLLLDFNNVPFDSNQGVGLARKVAADTALALIDRQQIKQPWIHSTDADVVLPKNYFKTVRLASNASAISLPFVHESDDASLKELQLLYDFKLYYYQWGMKQIGVAYDYIPLGSTLIVAAAAYAMVRGFPIKSGGEDFYLLNKLAKIGQVAQPQSPAIKIQCRLSDRVPFGTGPAVQKYQDSLDEPRYYHPKIFEVIKHWRQKLLAQYHQANIMTTATDDEALLNEFWSWSDVFQKNKSQIKSEQRWQQFIHEWLDAFKLLKSVHELKAVYPDVHQQDTGFKPLVAD